jgi:hypothetical protein
MRSQLTGADISNINGGGWVAEYCYYKNGDMAYRTLRLANLKTWVSEKYEF